MTTIPSTINTQLSGSVETGGTFFSIHLSNYDLSVLTNPPSGNANDHGRGPSEYFNTSLMEISLLCCTMIRSLPNMLRSAAIVMDLAFTLHTRFTRVSLNVFNFSCLIGLKKRDIMRFQSLISQVCLIPAFPFHVHSEGLSGYLLVLLNLSTI